MDSSFIVLLTVLMSLVWENYSFDFDGSSSSYAKLQSWVPCQNGSVSFEFKTLLPNALLFYTDTGSMGDYYELKLVNGITHLRFKLNKDRSALTVGQNLNDNQWHMVDIIRDGRYTTLKVDDVSYTREIKLYDPSVESEQSADNFVFIGGLPMEYNEKLSQLGLASVVFEPRLRGSVRNIFYSNCGKKLISPPVLDSVGIILDNDTCLQDNPCRNDGICVNRDNGVQCDCSWTMFMGQHCEIEKQPSEAMFKGAQYLTYDLSLRGDPIFSGTDRLSLHFRTQQPNGLLFYTGEDNDYMTVTLKDGAVHVAVELGSGELHEQVDLNGYKLDDNQWHHLVVNRVSRMLTTGIGFCDVNIEIDGVERASGTTMGDYEQLSSSILYVGGSPITSALKGSDIRSNFKGCMKQVEYKADSIQLDLTELAERGHELIAVMGDVEFGRCEDVVDSVPITFSTPESFIALPRWDVRRNMGTISFQFQTTEPNGLIMYNSGSYGDSNMDFFALEILDGNFYLILDLGSGAVKQKASRTKVDDGNIHFVSFQYEGKTGNIDVDGHRTQYTTPGQGNQLDLVELLFIGGIDFERHNSYRLPKELWSGMLGYGFVGCFQDLVINEIKIDLMTTARKQLQRDIVGNCRRTEPQCPSQPCLHRGECQEGWNRHICDCTGTSYSGRTCEMVPPSLLFDGAQYVLITLPEESHTEAEDILLRFRTIRASGLLMMTDSSQSTDSIELYLEGGACRLTVDLGSGSKTLSIGQALNDDQWHTVYVKRRGQEMELRIDNSRPVKDVLPLVDITVHITKLVLGSVAPILSDVLPGSNAVLMFDEIDIGSKMSRDTAQHHTGFVGAMQKFVFNNNHYFDMEQKDRIESVEITARFDNGESITRNAVTFKSKQAYVILPQLQANKHLAVYFKFKSLDANGLIMFNGRISHDFLALELYQGYLYYIYDMGGGSQRIRVNTPEPLNDNKWHDVSLLRPQVEQQLIRVDDNPPTVENMRDYSARRFDLKGPMYLGGVVKTLYNSLPMQVLSRNGFMGCIASLDLNGYATNILKDATSVEHSVVEGCSTTDVTCHSNACYNGGQCIQQWNSYVCDCDMTSFTGPTCTDESVTCQFGLRRGLITFEHPADSRPSTNSDYLALGFKTIQDYAMLVRIDSANNDDFIEMNLMDGNILVIYNMGKIPHPIGQAYHKVNDGKYHVVRFVRSAMNASLQVDNLSRTTKNPSGDKMSVFNDQARVWIGGRLDEHRNINNAYSGTISGLVFNGDHILDLLKEGDPRVSMMGDINLIESGRTKAPISPGNEMQSTEQVKHTTPKHKVTDEIISSGVGPDCYSDDEDQCLTIGSGAEDDIITPAVIVNRVSVPKTETESPSVSENITCESCEPQGTELIRTPVDGETTRSYGNENTLNPAESTVEPGDPQQTKKPKSGHLNIFLIIGIAAGVLVALIILVIALYKFRSREEGSYRVDESQNFAYLETKKQQTNGSVVNNTGNGKAGKKKDVKEWYV